MSAYSRKARWQRAALLPLLLLGAALLISGVRMSVAGVESYRAEAFLNVWRTKAEEPAPRAWQTAHTAAQQAVAWYPVANGDYQDRLGQVYSWQHFRQPFGDEDAEPSRRAALAAFRAAVAARPIWPASQARLLHSKLYLGEFDTEFAQVFSQAATNGAWRHGINGELAEIGLLAWPSLNSEQRRLTLEQAQRGIAASAGEARKILTAAEHAGRADMLCQELADELKATRRICQ